MNEGFQLINSATRATEYPDTWQHPTAADIAELAQGGYIKIGVESLSENIPGERFWVRVGVINMKDRTVTGKVEQIDMVFGDKHGINHDDEITVSFDEVCGTYEIEIDTPVELIPE